MRGFRNLLLHFPSRSTWRAIHLLNRQCLFQLNALCHWTWSLHRWWRDRHRCWMYMDRTRGEFENWRLDIDFRPYLKCSYRQLQMFWRLPGWNWLNHMYLEHQKKRWICSIKNMYLNIQWAAVKMVWGVMMDPPQKCSSVL